jgi:two-component system sensor histidine kinase HydH
METVADVRRRVRNYALQGGSRSEIAHRIARTRLLMVFVFQGAVVAFLAARGFPAERVLVHGGICLFYLAFARYPKAPVSHGAKVRLMMAGLLSYWAWVANTGGLASPLLPLGLSMLSPVSLLVESRRQKQLFVTGSLLFLVALAWLTHSRLGALVPPLVIRDGQVSLEYLLVAMGAIIVTGVLLQSFWYKMMSAYDQVALELGTRREELCSASEDRTREIEGAAAHLAHELKNPLASIKCLSAHLARCQLDPKTVERLGVVSSEADRMEAIVDGFAGLSSGLADLKLAPTRPHEIARELALLLEARAREAGIAVEVWGDAAAEIEADEKKIHRALFHLVVNAMQASRPGQLVTIEVGPPGREAQIKVVDRGQGMSAAVLQRVGSPYFTTRAGGAGLGVAVARTLIEQHGGRLEYRSVPGSGTTATITLPLRPPLRRDAPRLVLGGVS